MIDYSKISKAQKEVIIQILKRHVQDKDFEPARNEIVNYLRRKGFKSINPKKDPGTIIRNMRNEGYKIPEKTPKKSNSRNKNSIIDPKDYEDIKGRLESKQSMEKIAEEMGLSNFQVYNQIKKMVELKIINLESLGIVSYSKKGIMYKQDEMILEYKILYGIWNGKTKTEIAKKLGVTTLYIKDRLYYMLRNGINISELNELKLMRASEINELMRNEKRIIRSKTSQGTEIKKEVVLDLRGVLTIAKTRLLMYKQKGMDKQEIDEIFEKAKEEIMEYVDAIILYGIVKNKSVEDIRKKTGLRVAYIERRMKHYSEIIKDSDLKVL